MTARKIGVRDRVRLDTYGIISDAVERGLHYGWNRVCKYHEGSKLPDMYLVVDYMHTEVMNALSEVMQFDEASDEGR